MLFPATCLFGIFNQIDQHLLYLGTINVQSGPPVCCRKMNERIREYENQGNSKRRATKMAEKYVAIPGTSEHQLGLSVDINADQTKCSSEKVYSWLANNAYKYGFIKRYPSSKSYITGINNEPWHYRYVGKEAAATIKNQNLCLEEYLKKYK